MVRKNQLKRFSLQKLHQFAKQNTDGQTLTMVNEVIVQKNENLRDKTKQLKSQIQKGRKQTKKVIKQLNQAVHDRLIKKQKIVMDRTSRPTSQDIKNLTQLYGYIEKQTQLIDRNNKNIDKTLTFKEEIINILSIQAQNPEQKYTELDNEYQRLNIQCSIQQQKLTKKKDQSGKFKSHLQNINKSIQIYRVKYEQVQDLIRKRQRELDHFVTYFKNRNQEDEQNIERQRKITRLLQDQLLKNQLKVNINSNQNNDLGIMDIEAHSVQI